ncbi:MAG: hypothetical protein Q8P76_02650 [bacterium]|nr:hypothetical protein [bacterium]
MIIYLYGPDGYRRQEKLKSIIADYKKKHSAFAVERLDLAESGSLNKLKDFLKSQSLFDKLRLGIIEGYRELEDGQLKEFAGLLKENADAKEPTLVLLDEKAPNKDFKFLLEKPTLAQEFENYDYQKFGIFIQMEAKKRGISLDSESQDLLAQVYNGNTWGLITELDKLALLDEKKITKVILDKHLDMSLPLNIFSALGQMQSARGVGARLSILEELFHRSQDAAMIFNMSSVFVKTPADKEKMADYDVAIKSGKLEYEEALIDICLESRM